MESVAQQALNLLQLAGVPLNFKSITLEDGSVNRTLKVPQPLRWLIAHRNTTGQITITVPVGQCLAITLIEGSGIDFSQPNTMSVENSSDTLALSAQPLQTVIDTPSLYVFRPGQAIFSFVFTAQPGATARVQIYGFRLPQAALANLSRIATEQLSF